MGSLTSRPKIPGSQENCHTPGSLVASHDLVDEFLKRGYALSCVYRQEHYEVSVNGEFGGKASTLCGALYKASRKFLKNDKVGNPVAKKGI